MPATYHSEIAKHREKLLKYCHDEQGRPAPGVDIASGGDCLAPWGWSMELPYREYARYNSNQQPRGPIQLRGDAWTHRCAEPGSLSWVCSSHLLEDKLQSEWPGILSLWSSMLKSGGYLIILVPERERWRAAIQRGQPPNCSHAGPEPLLGDVSKVATAIGLKVIEERIAEPDTLDYSIIAVFQKP